MAKPVVFISSTCEDLKQTGHRNAARDAAIAAGFYPEMQEYWQAKDNPPLDECLARVEEADVLVAIVAYRFGWVPDEQGETDRAERRSITWLECQKAKDGGKDVLAFVVDPEREWSAELREEYEVFRAVQENKLTPELSADVQWRVNRLKDFKAWLSDARIRKTFATADDLRGEIKAALLERRADRPTAQKAPARQEDPSEYLRLLLEETSHIDIRGLQVESGRAQRLPIDELYIPLTTTLAAEREKSARGREDKKDAQLRAPKRARTELDRALKDRALVILGDPGSGKTTFLRRIAYGLCNSRLGLEAPTTAETLGLGERPLPVFVRISRLAEHIEAWCGRKQGEPAGKTSPAWLAHFLATAGAEEGTGLDREFFDEIINTGPAMVLLDGLDETPTREQRECIAELVTKAARRFKRCRFVVTSRPPAFEGRAVLPQFRQLWIDPLQDEVVEEFLAKWCAALFVGSERQAQEHRDALVKAVRSRLDIRRMARNPLMLTALAVVHWHEKRLPEQRADLYESILTWLSRSRERRPGRPGADVCVNRLQELALAMQAHAEGRQVQVSRRWAAEQIAPEWPEPSERRRIEAAERFLAEEELDSGIVVRRGDDIRFWHLTFQEFLAARAIGARGEQEQEAILLAPPDQPVVYLSSWREAVILLAGVLYKQGRRKVDAFVSAVLEVACGVGKLSDGARCAGLLGAAVRDLSAVGYQPADPRYQQLLDRVMGIFDAECSRGIDIRVAIDAAEALGQAGDPRFAEAACEDNWVTIPAGEFRMGAQRDDPSKPHYDAEAHDDESPVHAVTLEAYRIGRYPVTVVEFQRFMDAGGYEDRSFWSQGGFGQWKGPEDWEEQLAHPNRPVVGVSWCEACAYAAWRGCRLPTEAQWERAARGTEGRRYPWGSDDPDSSRMNYYHEGAVGHPTPVGVYPGGATPDGLLDMGGNVWEWCADWLDEDYYSKAREKDPQGPSSGSSRALRGGSWGFDPWYCRGASRDGIDPDGCDVFVGFRLVSCCLGPSK